MPFNTVATNQAVTSAFLNTNYRDQVVTTCTSVTRPAGTEGQLIYETDTDQLLIYTGAAWVQHGGLNAWVSYTPSTSGITTGNGTLYGRYQQVGKLVFFKARFTLGSTSAVTGSIILGLPVTGITTNMVASTIGCGFLDASGPTAFIGYAAPTTTVVTCLAVATGGTYGSYNAVSSTVPFTWTTSDYVEMGGFYEAA